jgi:DNA/RNA-binding domain of Phe-tRNA-synthetase-like protein
MIALEVDPRWFERFPGARLGLLEAKGLEPLQTHPALEQARLELEEELRATYGPLDRKTLREHPVLKVFEAHYRSHGKTYHVLQQLESVAAKGRSIPARICAVTALFMAELRHGLVAAGHDLEKLSGPLILGASIGGETYTNLGGKPCVLPADDMFLRDARGILSSVLQGPEQSSPIGPGTRSALFTIYAPAGLPDGALETQLQDLARFLRCYSPDAELRTDIVPAP